ncbi:cation diffusion facilitator family transporter [Rhodovulum adriaticum]|uniref:Ferrous-iron efflux pump FieF n=1 Tax=Rhodovulum adriaticum TaxID=35804 RepID=A0A4R2NWG9_RHOAD|nr:cation diffusion facilitator family transporter [Rhodovulum adriaticum]MBK1636227.1 cation-efflux pump [Rhodovulum adriaticum]TCP26519.1 ferrous-iron efflux pump FieF [Rhodovulum adriaticum]
MPDAHRLNLSAGLASVTVAALLVGLKIWALGETQALSVAASLADSTLDLMMSLGGLAAILYAARPPDEDHTFGHSSAEDLAALGQAVFILASAGVIGVAALLRLTAADPIPLTAEGRGIAAMSLAIALTLGLVLWQRRVAARTGNRVVRADSLHYLGDLLPNIGAILALWASDQFGLARLDSAIALATAAMLAVGALGIGRGAWDALMDRAADPQVIVRIERLAENQPGVLGFHDLKTRRAGARLFVNLHIELDGRQSLNDAHAIGAALKHAILAEFPGTDIIIHFDPARRPDTPG